MQRLFELIQFYLRVFLMIVWVMVASVLVLPLAIVRWKNPNNNKLFGIIYGPVSQLLMGIKVEVEGWEHWTKHQPCIYVCNHQSALDMTTFSKVLAPGALVIGKKEVSYIPIFGFLFAAFGNVLIDRKNRTHAVAGLNEAVDALKKHGNSLFIFPEGTRNREAIALLPFKKGPFYMALAAQVPLLPMVCSRVGHIVNFDQKIAKSGTVKIRILPPIVTQGKTEADVEALLQETYQKMQKAFEEINVAR